MRHVVLVSVLAITAPVAAAAVASWEPPGAPMNLDFELKALAGWHGSGPGYEVAIDVTVAHVGERSGRLSRRPEVPRLSDGVGGITQAVSAERWRGARVSYSGWLKTEDVGDGWAGLWCRIDGPDGEVLGFDNLATSGREIRGTTDWTHRQIVLDVPEDAVHVTFGALLAGDGHLWIDGLSLGVTRKTDLEPTTAASEPHRTLTVVDVKPGERLAGFGFETLRPWGGGAAGYERALDCDVRRAGECSGRIQRTASTSAFDFATFVLTVSAQPWQGGKLRFSGWLRTAIADEGWAALWARVDAADGTVLAFDNMDVSDRAVRGTRDWERHEIVLAVPEDAASISFGSLLVGDGTAWFDEFSLTRADEATPVTRRSGAHHR